MAKYVVRLSADDLNKKKYPEISAELYENKILISSVLLTLDTRQECELDIRGDEDIAEILIELARSFKEKIVELSEG
ncbi:hypothetical protein V2K62_13685 [Pseudomonas alliivorans]|uniref:Uncharacterized protein n=2 Tax=Pseudomonas TaxID=286 RepID=A0A1X0NBP9_9PSED|nr:MULTISPECIES: hypothetical protein [Pseudomonas]MBP0939985.1 hypothetical protein [Pseudomonas alliivorans]MBP0945567.1 hypothetical protein [Pseudomonas alliivorans]MBP0950817.1 hypothetical protein [Pseudomonas alliivorans]MCO5367703.1 hypothetical protein [Pseudomonas alliivorans]MEE4306274.1 hypothetical protein [Pseudomonas alliivorans]